MKKYYLILILLSAINISSYSQVISDLFEKLDSSVVIIKVTESKTTGEGKINEKVIYGSLGSGVLIDKSGTILTAAHVVNNADLIEVVFINGQKLKAKVQGSSKVADIAVIKTQGIIKDPKPAKLGNSDSTKIGEKIMIIGSPMGLYHSLSVGYISRKESEKQISSNFKSMEFFQTDAAINTGNSGGPMFNLKGEVIGIVSSILTRSGGFEGIGFVATINIIKELLLEQSNTWLGIDIMYLSGPLAKAFNLPVDGGVLITNVAKGSPAKEMGLRGGYISAEIAGQPIVIGGDIILAIDDKTFETYEKLEIAIRYLNSIPKGKSYTLKILRGGKIIKVKWKIP